MDYYIIYDIRIQYETHFNIRIQDIQHITHARNIVSLPYINHPNAYESIYNY